MSTVTQFIKQYRFLSNFWETPVEFEGVIYPSAEHAYQAAKTLEPEYRESILLTPTPGKAKRLGKHVPIRPDWDDVKLEVMETILRDKFGPHNAGLNELLSVTKGQELIEGNFWHDNYWGVCYGTKNCDCADNPQGQNNLGLLLMKIRDENEENTMKCTATTNSGNPCKNNPKQNEQLCGPHLARAYKEMEMEQDMLDDNPALEVLHQEAQIANAPDEIKVAVVGHRPDKLGGYRADVSHLEAEVLRIVEKLQELHPNAELVDLCGTAQGADWIGARVFLRTNRPYETYTPFSDFGKNWPLAAQKKLAALIENAREQHVVTENVKGYNQVVKALFERNAAMIDDADYVVAIWNGDEKGGTAHAMSYAHKHKKPTVIISIDDEGQILKTVKRNFDA